MATVTIVRDVGGGHSKSKLVELASAIIVDGKFTLLWEIEEPTEGSITANVGEEELELTTSVLLVPKGEEICFVKGGFFFVSEEPLHRFNSEHRIA